MKSADAATGEPASRNSSFILIGNILFCTLSLGPSTVINQGFWSHFSETHECTRSNMRLAGVKPAARKPQHKVEMNYFLFVFLSIIYLGIAI